MVNRNLTPVSGFTLIELIIVIVIIGILAVSVAPQFVGRQGVDELAYQARLVNVLRQQQQRAMQDTKNCYAVFLSSSEFGPVNDCDATSLQNTRLDLNSAEALDASVTLTVAGTSLPRTIPFNALGCPTSETCADSTAGVSISIIGTRVLPVCVESQGYIHAGECDS